MLIALGVEACKAAKGNEGGARRRFYGRAVTTPCGAGQSAGKRAAAARAVRAVGGRRCGRCLGGD